MGIFVGSTALLLFLALLSKLGLKNFIDFSSTAISYTSVIPLFIGSLGGTVSIGDRGNHATSRSKEGIS